MDMGSGILMHNFQDIVNLCMDVGGGILINYFLDYGYCWLHPLSHHREMLEYPTLSVFIRVLTNSIEELS